MKCIRMTILAAVMLAILATGVLAQDSKPINLALFDPVQIFNRDTAIHGLRLNIYGVNSGLKGVDIGIANWITGDAAGIQYGIINMTKGDFTGWQTGPISFAQGHMTGLQTSGLFNLNGSGKGLQFGLITVSDNFVGLQLGLVNYAVEYHGIQLGLINIIKQGGMLPFFPIFNFSFD